MVDKDNMQERYDGRLGSMSTLGFCGNVATCEMAMEDLEILGATGNDKNE